MDLGKKAALIRKSCDTMVSGLGAGREALENV